MIALITPSGGRQAQINICASLMKKQTYTGDVVWIIVDDCEPITTNGVTKDFPDNWTTIMTYPSPVWKQGFNTQARNLSVGINKLLSNYDKKDIEGIFIIEDDDYYRPEYLEKMLSHMGDYSVIGEVNTIYYNVYFRRYVSNGNMKHASLFQVAFSPEAIQFFRMSFDDKFIDSKFFRLLDGIGVNLFKDNNLAIGIKGMPGREGIGAGHSRAMNMRDDSGFQYLTALIGEDAKIYERYYGNNRQ